MPAEITSNMSGTSPELVEHLSRTAAVLLAALDHHDSELEVTLVGDAEIADMNRDYRGKNRPTDVLSFPQLEGEPVAGGDDDVHLGDIVISIETASHQAADGGWTLEEESARLLLHGLLHLLGFDHEQGGDEEVRMKAEEARLVAVLHDAGVACAYEAPSSSS